MRKRLMSGVLAAAVVITPMASGASEGKPEPEEVKAITRKVADWQIATFDRHGEFRALPSENRKKWQNKNDKEEHLFWRDSSFFGKREEIGRKVFWARGNGWVFGGLALMIPDLPEDWEGCRFHIDIYKQMAVKLKEIQRKDGTWSMGLLGGAEGYPNRETSGTSFYTIGMAWGINNGLLDRETYEPVVLKGWNALTKCVTAEGMLGWVQPVGAAPGESFGDKTEVYGTGAFLAAGSEVYKMVGAK